MITKKEFVDIINRLKETDDFVKETNIRAKKLKDAVLSDYFNSSSLSISHEDIVVKLLEDMFGDYYTLGWWLYELDYGREYKKGCFKDKNRKNINVSTPEKLYDYLVANK